MPFHDHHVHLSWIQFQDRGCQGSPLRGSGCLPLLTSTSLTVHDGPSSALTRPSFREIGQVRHVPQFASTIRKSRRIIDMTRETADPRS